MVKEKKQKSLPAFRKRIAKFLEGNRSDTHLLERDDCLSALKDVPDDSINLIIVDPPYGVSRSFWDTIIPLDELFAQLNRVIKPTGIIIVSATQPFASKVINANAKYFRYDLVWEKTIASGQLNVRKMPLRTHEHMLIFYRKAGGTYNEQLTKGPAYKRRRCGYRESGYDKQTESVKDNEGYRHARSILKVPNPRQKGGHPAQKPIELLQYLIRTYSNTGDIVLDCCMGSGSTGAAAIAENRKFIGMEKEQKWFSKARKWLSFIAKIAPPKPRRRSGQKV